MARRGVNTGTLFDRHHPELRAELARGILNARGATTLAELERLIATGQLDRIVRPGQAAFRVLSNRLEVLYARAASDAIEGLGGDLAAFDLAGIDAQTHLASIRQRIEDRLVADARDAIALEANRPVARTPRARAQAVRASYGLSARQVEQVARFEQVLERGSAAERRAALRAKGLDPSAGDTALNASARRRILDGYRERLVVQRVDEITALETQRAVGQAADAATTQALRDGLISGTLETWRTRRDNRVRDTHAAMEGQQREGGVPFTTGAGVSIRWPGDHQAPQSETAGCRCRRAIQAIALAQAA